VAATVHEGGLETSLLGMSFLDRLASFERRGDRLILHPR
jgi:predicted aspartyl protease